uniref:Putative secreted protein n=1 Tax=Anopheles darlingi TaxID=43151 RepID=A0A2M4D2I1_ANODA
MAPRTAQAFRAGCFSVSVFSFLTRSIVMARDACGEWSGLPAFSADRQQLGSGIMSPRRFGSETKRIDKVRHRM